MYPPVEPDEVPVLRRIVAYTIVIVLLAGVAAWTWVTLRDGYIIPAQEPLNHWK